MEVINGKKKTHKMPIGLQTNKIKYDIVSAGFDPELMDAKSFIDSTLSFTENRHNVASQLGYKIGGKKTNPSGMRGGSIPTGMRDMMSQADDYSREERSRRSAEKRKTQGPRPPRKTTKAKFKKMKKSPAWQSDSWKSIYSEEADRSRIALPPGRRLSKSGNIYYERRRNRSDMPGKRV
jgi:hypothetical protein